MSTLFIGGLIGVSFIYYLSQDIETDKKVEDLALGKDTETHWGQVNGFPVHCSDFVDMHKCINSYYEGGQNQEIVLWLGNSQLHAINQIKPKDTTAIPILHRYVKKDLKYLLTFSQPNANLKEHQFLFEYLVKKLPITTLVLPVVFDDMRETGVRSSLIDADKNQRIASFVKNSLHNKTPELNQPDLSLNEQDMIALEDTIQKHSEKYLDLKLKKIWGIWEQRPILRGKILNGLYLFRNRLFGINASTVRRIIPARYQMNMQAFREILQLTKKKNIKALVYIAPLRNDVNIPYDSNEYSNFKTEIQLISEEYDVKFFNFENLVPGEYWGTKESTTIGGDSELDFMHFQAGGHKLLADGLYSELIKFWNK
ncbi:hypothetical protein OAO13_03520 [Candidatus Pseudothioglobus singularis]|nr:hypothetical protein [Candidatus Pseudothioglobus singularis]